MTTMKEPEVRTVLIEGTQRYLLIDGCPFCGEYHTHGSQPGGRGSHCGDDRRGIYSLLEHHAVISRETADKLRTPKSKAKRRKKAEPYPQF